MIHVSNLSKSYAKNTVLSIDQLDLQAGEIIGLVGNNGAGKTTFFSLLLDLIKPTTGCIENQGVQVDQSEAWKKETAAFIDENFLIYDVKNNKVKSQPYHILVLFNLIKQVKGKRDL